MGRRRSKRKPPPKRKMIEDLPSTFTCPFCNSENSCEVDLDQTKRIGMINCSVCLEQFSTVINYLTEPLDVYSEWIDACEAANDETVQRSNTRRTNDSDNDSSDDENQHKKEIKNEDSDSSDSDGGGGMGMVS